MCPPTFLKGLHQLCLGRDGSLGPVPAVAGSSPQTPSQPPAGGSGSTERRLPHQPTYSSPSLWGQPCHSLEQRWESGGKNRPSWWLEPAFFKSCLRSYISVGTLMVKGTHWRKTQWTHAQSHKHTGDLGSSNIGVTAFAVHKQHINRGLGRVALDVTYGISGLSGNGRAQCCHRSLFPWASGLLLTEHSLGSNSALNPPQPQLPPPNTYLCHLLPLRCLPALPRQQPGQVLLAPRPPPHLMGSPSPHPRLRAPVCAPQGGPGTGTRSPGGCQSGSACVWKAGIFSFCSSCTLCQVLNKHSVNK